MSWISIGNNLYRHTVDELLSRSLWQSSTLICLVIMGAFPLFAVYTHALTITYNTLLLLHKGGPECDNVVRRVTVNVGNKHIIHHIIARDSSNWMRQACDCTHWSTTCTQLPYLKYAGILHGRMREHVRTRAVIQAAEASPLRFRMLTTQFFDIDVSANRSRLIRHKLH